MNGGATASNPTARVLFASLVGTTIEFFDFYSYATAAVLVFPHLFFPERSDDGCPAIVCDVRARLPGATDRLGSVRALRRPHRAQGDPGRCLADDGPVTVAIGLLPTYASIGVVAPFLLALCRLGQGLGLGGEWGGAVLLATEHAPPGKRAWFGMFPQLGAPLGFFLATGTFLLMSATLDDETRSSRGAAASVPRQRSARGVGLWIRLRISETPAFQRVIAATRTGPRSDAGGVHAPSPNAACWDDRLDLDLPRVLPDVRVRIELGHEPPGLLVVGSSVAGNGRGALFRRRNPIVRR
jgi:hypothetical protein